MSCGNETDLILDSLLQSESTALKSDYTGKLIRIGNAEAFGASITTPMAIEWDGQTLYMIAKYGRYPSHGMALFTLDRFTGVANGSGNIAGFGPRRGFTQTLNFFPQDMVWIPEKQTMLAVCATLDSILRINLNNGRAERLTFEKGFCVFNNEGNPTIGSGNALGYDGISLYMASVSLIPGTFRSEFYTIDSSYRCATFIGNIGSIDHGKVKATTLCFDGQYMYMADDKAALSIIDRNTGYISLISKFYFDPMPEGYTTHELGVLHIEKNAVGLIDITGLAYDGENMYAVDALTDALYLLERVD